MDRLEQIENAVQEHRDEIKSYFPWPVAVTVVIRTDVEVSGGRDLDMIATNEKNLSDAVAAIQKRIRRGR